MDGELERALRHLPEGGGELVYRGWMLAEERYSELFCALWERGLHLVTDPQAYASHPGRRETREASKRRPRPVRS